MDFMDKMMDLISVCTALSKKDVLVFSAEAKPTGLDNVAGIGVIYFPFAQFFALLNQAMTDLVSNANYSNHFNVYAYF